MHLRLMALIAVVFALVLVASGVSVVRDALAAPMARGQQGRDADAILRAAPLRGEGWCARAGDAVTAASGPAAIEAALEMCRSVGRHELALIERRLQISMVLWPLLSARQRQASLAEVALVLKAPQTGDQMMPRFGVLVARAAPERVGLMRGEVGRHRPELVRVFDAIVAEEVRQQRAERVGAAALRR